MKTLLATLAFLLIPCLVRAETIGDYKQTLDKIRTGVRVVDKVDTYKDVKLKNKKTGDLKKVSDFPEFEQRVFVYFMALRREQELKQLHNLWADRLQGLMATGGEGGSEDDPDSTLAKPLHVKKFIADLIVQRKLLAQTTERTLEQLYKDFPDRFDDKEKEFSLKHLKELHDKQGLGR